MDSYLVKEEHGGLVSTRSQIIENPHYLSLISHPLRVRILNMLTEQAMYPAEIANKLRVHEQTLYYHIQKLHKAGIIEVVEKKSIRGTTAKKFRPSASAFSLVLSEKWEPFESVKKDHVAQNFLSPFIRHGALHGYVVVGSPIPHGPLRASARDGHYGIDLALFLGKCMSIGENFSVKLDTDVIEEDSLDENLIIIGGPITNLLMERFRDALPVRFTKEAPHGLQSTKTKKRYAEDSVGFLAKLPNPLNPKKSLMIIAGIRAVGTKSVVLALTRYTDQVLKKYNGQEVFSTVIQGFDRDNDGKIDDIVILE